MECTFLSPHVHVMPYKIAICGPAGHFGNHQGTPETRLVATFQLGFGASSNKVGRRWQGRFIAGQHWAESAGTWHASINHDAEKIGKGYRAVLAFKLY